MLIVVGGRNSNNAKQLVEMGKVRGVPSFLVESAAEVRPEWLRECARVGLTAGASTLEDTIEEVRRALEQLSL